MQDPNKKRFMVCLYTKGDDFIKSNKKITDFTHLLKASFINIESDTSISTSQKINTVIHSTSIICASIAIQPIPFADALILTPIQMLMIGQLTRIAVNDWNKQDVANNKDLELSKRKINAGQIMQIMVASCGTGLIAQQGVLGLYKTFIPFLGAITTIPLVYAATFAIGKTAHLIIDSQLKGIQLDKDKIRKYHETIIKEKEAEVKEQENYNEFLKKENNLLENRINELEKYNAEMVLQYENLLDELSENSNSKNELITESAKIHSTICSLIDSAQKSIYLQIFNISEYDILLKLTERSRNNISVRILTDFSTINSLFNTIQINSSANQGYSFKTINKILNCFEQSNTEVKIWGRNVKQGIMHRKDIIIDEKLFLLGSANYSKSAKDYNIESAILIKDIAIVKQDIEAFLNVYTSSETEIYKRENFLKD